MKLKRLTITLLFIAVLFLPRSALAWELPKPWFPTPKLFLPKITLPQFKLPQLSLNFFKWFGPKDDPLLNIQKTEKEDKEFKLVVLQELAKLYQYKKDQGE